MYAYGYFNSFKPVASGAVPFDADAQAFITAASITDPTQQSAINTFYTSLKADGIYSKMKAMYLPITGSAATSKFNMVNPVDSDAAFRLSFLGGWSFSSSGATPNGTTGYANTFLTPNGLIAQNSASLSVYLRTNNVGVYGDIGCYDNSSQLLMYPRVDYLVNSSAHIRLNTSLYNGDYAAVTTSTGFFLATRTASNVQKLFQSGTLKVNGTYATNGVPSVPVYLGAHYIQLNVPGNYSNRQIAFASIGDGLNDTESGNFYTAVNTLMTTLGINV